MLFSKVTEPPAAAQHTGSRCAHPILRPSPQHPQQHPWEAAPSLQTLSFGSWAVSWWILRAVPSSRTGWWRALVHAPEGTAAAAASHTNHFLSHLSFLKHGFVCLGRAMLKCNSQSTGKLMSENWGRTMSRSSLMANTAHTQHKQSPTVYVLSEHGGKDRKGKWGKKCEQSPLLT